MKLDAYGKLLEIVRENDTWAIYQLGEGRRSRSHDIVIPSDFNKSQVIQFLEDMLHESATPQRRGARY